MSLSIVILGLSITSSWGNGHATTYRALVRGLAARGHDVLFLERDVPWYAANRDLPDPGFCRVALYDDPAALARDHAAAVRGADLVIVGSYVPDGIGVGRWVQDTARGITAFYDIDTPITLEALAAGTCAYLSPALIPGFDLYLSFTYCAVDPDGYYPEDIENAYDLGYMGTYSDDRQPGLERLLLEPARRAPDLRFVVAGPQYPDDIDWPPNVERIEHLPPAEHRRFYNSQRFTLNVTRADMIAAGYAPSVRLFEAAACATPIISDYWDGLETIFEPGEEILIGRSPEDTLRYLRETAEDERRAIGERARRRVLAEHTVEHRAEELEHYIEEAANMLKV